MFFTDDDRHAYLGWLKEYAEKHEVDILAYCLMPNHIHLVAVPATEDNLQQALKPLHMRYAQRINRARGWKGHVWQGRFFSSPLDEAYLWAAMRYVERNPVRAKMVRKAENYRWSSAAAHCRVREDEVLTKSQAGASNSKRLAIGPPGWPRVTRRSNWKSCGATPRKACPAVRRNSSANWKRWPDARYITDHRGGRGKTTVKKGSVPFIVGY